MKIKTYTAPDMRQALRLVRDEQGPDAVMLSSRQLPEGVEISVAVEPDSTDIAPLVVAPEIAAEGQRGMAYWMEAAELAMFAP